MRKTNCNNIHSCEGRSIILCISELGGEGGGKNKVFRENDQNYQIIY